MTIATLSTVNCQHIATLRPVTAKIPWPAAKPYLPIPTFPSPQKIKFQLSRRNPVRLALHQLPLLSRLMRKLHFSIALLMVNSTKACEWMWADEEGRRWSMVNMQTQTDWRWLDKLHACQREWLHLVPSQDWASIPQLVSSCSCLVSCVRLGTQRDNLILEALASVGLKLAGWLIQYWL